MQPMHQETAIKSWSVRLKWPISGEFFILLTWATGCGLLTYPLIMLHLVFWCLQIPGMRTTKITSKSLHWYVRPLLFSLKTARFFGFAGEVHGMRMDHGVVFHFLGVGVSFFRHVPSACFTQLWKISVLKQIHHHKSSISMGNFP